MTKRHFAFLCAPLFALRCVAQDVPPPPRPDAVDPSLAPLLESLKQTLLSSGRVEYSYTPANGTTVWNWQQITSAVMDVRGCQARMHYDSSDHGRDPTDRAVSLFFESIDTVESLTQQEANHRTSPPLTFSGDVASAGPLGPRYTLTINGQPNQLGPFLFENESDARKAAETIGRAAQICRAAPVTLNSGAGAPSLADTLHFIEDRLNDSGSVNYREIYQNLDGSPMGTQFSWSDRLSQAVADPSTCLIRVNYRATRNGATNSDYRQVISLRRVEKLEVAERQDVVNRARAQAGLTGLIKTEPVVFQLSVIYLSGGRLALYFINQEIANRIAKAMNHAVELCGGGSKDPF